MRKSLFTSLILFLLSTGGAFAQSAQPSAAPQPNFQQAPLPSVAQRQLAVQWLALLQAGKVDRTQLTQNLSTKLTDRVALELSATLRPYGDPVSIAYLGGRIVNDDDVYAFVFTFKSAKLREMMAFDKDGKIDGLVFNTMK